MSTSRSTALENRFTAIENSAKDATNHGDRISSLMATAKRLAKLSEKQGNFRIVPIESDDYVGFELLIDKPERKKNGIWDLFRSDETGVHDHVTYRLELSTGHVWQAHSYYDSDIVNLDKVQGLATRWLRLNTIEPPRADRRRAVTPSPTP